jgi:hypothetical protein
LASQLAAAAKQPPAASILTDAPQSGVEISERPELVTFGLDAQDYNFIAQKLLDSIHRTTGLVSGSQARTLVLGPVDQENSLYPLDARTLQEKVSNSLQRINTFQVSFAADSLSEENAQSALQRILTFNFEKSDITNPEDLMLLGGLADVDLLLFGRLSSHETVSAGLLEVVYVFNWKIGNTRNGLLEWSEDIEIVKRGPVPEVPIWFTYRKPDSGEYFRETGIIEGTDDAEERLFQNLKSRLAHKINEVHFPGNEIIKPISADRVTGLIEKRISRDLEQHDGRRNYMVVRIPRRDLRGLIEDRERAFKAWSKVNDRFTDLGDMDREERRKEIPQLRTLFSDFLTMYPMEESEIVYTESIWLMRGDFEELLGDVYAASENYKAVIERSPSDAWRRRAHHKLEAIHVSQEDITRHKIRRFLEGKTVSCSAKLKDADTGKTYGLPKIESEIAKFLEEYDALVTKESSAQKDGAFHFRFEVIGNYQRTPDNRAKGGEKIGFTGTLHYGFFGEEGALFNEDNPISVGQIIFGQQMLNDMVALKTYELWKHTFLEYFTKEDKI